MGGRCWEGRNTAARSSTSKQKGVRVPSEAEIEEFLASMEGGGVGVRHFNYKYNYDCVRDEPMEEGRYQWVALKAERKLTRGRMISARDQMS